jgi:hypothetical protein
VMLLPVSDAARRIPTRIGREPDLKRDVDCVCGNARTTASRVEIAKACCDRRVAVSRSLRWATDRVATT